MLWQVLVSGLLLSFFIILSLGKKWEIEKRVTLPSAFILGISSGVVLNFIISYRNLEIYQIVILQSIIIILTAGSLILWRFYRDPERVSPEDEENILSPADGKVIYIKRIKKGEVPYSEKGGKKFLLSDFVQSDIISENGYLVGIAMNFLDVHVNRSPVDGRINLLKHINGEFLSLKRKEALVLNERAFTVINNGIFNIGIVQIASRLVRNIVPLVQEGADVLRGQRIGMIRFGSQVDVYLPDLPDLSIQCKRDEKVKAGLSVIARYEKE